MLISIKLSTSASFRAIEKIMMIVSSYLVTMNQTPAYSTILTWIQKIGYYKLMKPKEIADDWIIIIDESIKIGQDKLLVILGIRESKINFNRPLRYQDLTPLLERLRKSWTGESISKELIELKEEIGTIIYGVGDYGSNIKKGLRLASITHVYDITHKIATVIKSIYEKDKEYKSFTQNMAQMRTKLYQSEEAHIIPPSQRQKSRYQNIGIISAWGMKSLRHLSQKTTEEKTTINLKWVEEFEQFIQELNEINQVICKIQKILKYNGLSKDTVKECNQLLDEISNEKGIIFKERLRNYFTDQLELMPTSDKILCTSDIIESSFGKYKNYISDNPMAGITNLALCISAFTSNLDEFELKEALEKTRMSDIKNWTDENIGTTLLKKRREFFSDQKMERRII
ncbi:hypothetical protein MSIBF_A1420012 [groundwater metagenome]|uniref:Transposase n=1 Tax=groundwater metagenome TaxID=717931 RepID=A0A098E7C2_9ZZZZ